MRSTCRTRPPLVAALRSSLAGLHYEGGPSHSRNTGCCFGSDLPQRLTADDRWASAAKTEKTRCDRSRTKAAGKDRGPVEMTRWYKSQSMRAAEAECGKLVADQVGLARRVIGLQA